jgi:hypothetical protein
MAIASQTVDKTQQNRLSLRTPPAKREARNSISSAHSKNNSETDKTLTESLGFASPSERSISSLIDPSANDEPEPMVPLQLAINLDSRS